jgi:hypothetical protein
MFAYIFACMVGMVGMVGMEGVVGNIITYRNKRNPFSSPNF